MKFLLNYILQLSDNALIHGHRLSEWCGHGPVLEQDIALTNTALDHIGQARSLYQYAADIYNQLDSAERESLFTSAALLQFRDQATEDAMAYLRDSWDFKNALLLELPNKDWAYTIAKCFLYDNFTVLLYSALSGSADATIAAVAKKSLKEASYHRKWSNEWVIRLGDGTPESHERMQQALDDYWTYTGDLFKLSEADRKMLEQHIGTDVSALYDQWHSDIAAILNTATLTLPANEWRQEGGKDGRHTESLGYILAEMQYLQRTYPNAQW